MRKKIVGLAFSIAAFTIGAMAQNTFPATGNVGIGTTSPISPLHVAVGNDGTTGQANCGAESSACPSSATSGYGLTIDGEYTSGGYRWRFEPIDRGDNLPLYLEEATYVANVFHNVARFGADQYDNNWFEVFGNASIAGNVGIGTPTPAYTLDVAGTIHSTGNLMLGSGASIVFPDGSLLSTAGAGSCPVGGDYAESVDVTGDRGQYEPGDVIAIDPTHPGNFLKAHDSYSKLVAGVYSTKPGFVGRRQAIDKPKDGEIPMAMVGIVPTKVSAENGAIHVGDLLVASSTAGHAMKGTDRNLLTGAVIGKSLGTLESGTGIVEVMISLQ